MPSKPLRPCRQPGCSTLCVGGYCEMHKPVPKGDVSDSWHWMYGTRTWARLRSEQLLREPWCRECSRQGRERVRATDVDHIVDHRGRWEVFADPENLESLCHRCHSAKTLRDIRARTGGGKGKG